MITSSAWAGKRYAVLGLARSGAATVAALLASGARVTAWDTDAAKRHPPRHGEEDAGAAGGGGGPPWAEALAENPLHQPAAGPPPRAGEELSFADPLTLDLTGYDAWSSPPACRLNRHPIAAYAASFGAPVIGDIELFALARPTLTPHKVVGITGTTASPPPPL